MKKLILLSSLSFISSSFFLADQQQINDRDEKTWLKFLSKELRDICRESKNQDKDDCENIKKSLWCAAYGFSKPSHIETTIDDFMTTSNRYYQANDSEFLYTCTINIIIRHDINSLRAKEIIEKLFKTRAKLRNLNKFPLNKDNNYDYYEEQYNKQTTRKEILDILDEDKSIYSDFCRKF